MQCVGDNHSTNCPAAGNFHPTDRNIRPPTETPIPPTETPGPGGLVFTVQEVPGGQYGDGGTLAGGAWEGMTTENKTWLRVSFQVDSASQAITQIKYEVGCEGVAENVMSWNPQGATTTIQSGGSFEYTDKYGNFIKGIFGSGSYASGSVSSVPFNFKCPDGEFHPNPKQWRAAPK